jgi:hypothetical protein
MHMYMYIFIYFCLYICFYFFYVIIYVYIYIYICMYILIYMYILKVKGISARMASAKMYLSTDVVERLTRSGHPSPRDPNQSQQLALGFESEGDNVMDVASFMGTQQGYQTPFGGRTYAPNSARSKRSSSAPRTRSSFGSGNGMWNKTYFRIDRYMHNCCMTTIVAVYTCTDMYICIYVYIHIYSCLFHSIPHVN